MEFSSLLWAIPFLGIIFSMSLFPLLFEKFWNRHSSHVLFFWTLLYLFAVGYVFDFSKIFLAIFDPIVGHYIPFIVLIAALYIVSGGIFIDFLKACGPFFNTVFLFFGSILAGWIGTTGASTILIRPLLRANSGRKNIAHIVVFFIFLISNIGGAATPLGDPPLFIGFLEGVDFFWFFKNLYAFVFSSIFALCMLFFFIDIYLYKKENNFKKLNRNEKNSGIIFTIKGYRNLWLMLCILLAVVLCNFNGEFVLFGEKFSYSSLIRNIIISVIAIISIKITPGEIREKNCFSFAPIKEVAEVFAGIFITVTPIISILHKGSSGELSFVFDWISPGGEFIANRCFWVSGILSSVLDNAPTFLIFFHLLSGDATKLMTSDSNLLMAISLSTVFMGALTYIGNAPNLMIKSIACSYGAKIPSFVGYLLWSITILVPLFFVIAKFL